MEDHFEEFENANSVLRRDLLPWWIKVFSWLFMILGGIAIISLYTLFFGEIPQLGLFGIDAADFFPYGLIVLLATAALNAYEGYLLWFEKKEAIKIGKITVVWNLLLCVAVTIISLLFFTINFRKWNTAGR
jgi:uncharacterized protein (DUF3820 family)